MENSHQPIGFGLLGMARRLRQVLEANRFVTDVKNEILVEFSSRVSKYGGKTCLVFKVILKPGLLVRTTLTYSPSDVLQGENHRRLLKTHACQRQVEIFLTSEIKLVLRRFTI